MATNYGKKSAQVGHQVSHETLADQLLHELVQEEKGREPLHPFLASCCAGLWPCALKGAGISRTCS